MFDALVGEISEAFAENFSKIQCAGEVGIYKDEDFEHWAIQIKVKFRIPSLQLNRIMIRRQQSGSTPKMANVTLDWPRRRRVPGVSGPRVLGICSVAP